MASDEPIEQQRPGRRGHIEESHVTHSFDPAAMELFRHIAVGFNQQRTELRRVLSSLQNLENQMGQLTDKIADLTAKVSANTTVIGSASVLIRGFKAQLDAAVAAAREAGATDVELTALTDLSASVGQNTTELAAAIEANTAAPPAEPPTEPAVDPATGRNR